MATGAREDVPRSIFLTVLLLSAGVLMLQIALNRIFSYTIWYHFAYISVSLALLGFGASGAVLATLRGLGRRPLGSTLGVISIAAAVSTLGMLVVIGTLQVNPFFLVRDRLELAKLALLFAIVAIPFFWVGLAIAIALRAAGARVNALYAWDLVGAGLGCAIVIPCVQWLESPRVVVLVAALFAAAGIVAAGRAYARVRTAAIVMVVLALAAIGPLPGRLPFPPSSDKQINEWRKSGSATLYARWGPLFRVDMLDEFKGGDKAPFDYRWVGIGAKYDGPVPRHRVLWHDGTAGAYIYGVDPAHQGLPMMRHHVLGTPYVLSEKPSVLIIGIGGGIDVLNAIEHGARKITGAEIDPLTIDLLEVHSPEFTGGVYERPDVTLHASEGRHFVRSGAERYDLLQITGVDTLSALSTGAYVLSENYLYTVEAYGDFLRALTADGTFSIGTVDIHPRNGLPRHTLRYVGMSYEALRDRGVERPHQHVIVVGTTIGISSVEILTKPKPFTEAEIAAVERYIDENEFEAWYLPSRPARQIDAFRTLLEGTPAERDRFFAETFLDLRPPHDDQPFYFSFYRWRNLLAHRREFTWGHTLATGQIVLVIIFLMAVAFSLVTIVLPALFAGAEARRMPRRWGFLAYFAALGGGFILVEISFVQRFVLFLGHPTYSLTVTLAAFLAAAGAGAYLSGRLPAEPARALGGVVAALSAIIVLYVALLPTIFAAFLATPLAVRILVTVALCAPLGGVLGMFFPYGIRLTSAVNPDFSAWAWAVNGCVTVAGSVASIMIAITYGFTVVILIALGVYWLGAWSFVLAHRGVAAA